MPMKRMLFHIPHDQSERLAALAAARQVSVGELVRRFIDQGLMHDDVHQNVIPDLQRELRELRDALESLRQHMYDKVSGK
jgi:signal transduction protein with GAF and PtsI domain